MQALEIGRSQTVRRGEKLALLAFGSTLEAALTVGEQLNATVINMRFAKPLDEDAIREAASSHELIVTIEENAVIGGVGSEVSRFVDTLAERPRVLRLGLPDRFIDHGDQSQLLAEAGLDAAGILQSILTCMPALRA